MKFVGESVDDCGGGYSESIAEMCDELVAGQLQVRTLYLFACKVTVLYVTVLRDTFFL